MSFASVVSAAPVTQGGFEYTPVTKTDEEITISGTETDTVVWVPAAGNKIILMGVAYWSDVQGTFFVESGSTKVIPTSGICSTSGITVIGNGTPIWKGSADATLTYTTTINGIHSILMWGFESDR